jgi:hypothetical protein
MAIIARIEAILDRQERRDSYQVTREAVGLSGPGPLSFSRREREVPSRVPSLMRGSPSGCFVSGFGKAIADSSEGRASNHKEACMAGIPSGESSFIVGIVLMFVWSFWAGLIVALIGLVAFGGFVRGKW